MVVKGGTGLVVFPEATATISYKPSSHQHIGLGAARSSMLR
jgi:hypothetical protein